VLLEHPAVFVQAGIHDALGRVRCGELSVRLLPLGQLAGLPVVADVAAVGELREPKPGRVRCACLD